jgi:hypothetical protein
MGGFAEIYWKYNIVSVFFADTENFSSTKIRKAGVMNQLFTIHYLNLSTDRIQLRGASFEIVCMFSATKSQIFSCKGTLQCTLIDRFLYNSKLFNTRVHEINFVQLRILELSTITPVRKHSARDPFRRLRGLNFRVCGFSVFWRDDWLLASHMVGRLARGL